MVFTSFESMKCNQKLLQSARADIRTVVDKLRKFFLHSISAQLYLSYLCSSYYIIGIAYS